MATSSTRPETAGEALDGQSRELVGYLHTLYQRMMSRSRPADAIPDCSREEFRALIQLGHQGGATMSELAEHLGVPLSTATHTVDRLVSKRLVERQRSEKDRRVVQVGLSKKGEKVRDQMAAGRLAMAHSWLAPLSQGERQIFLELMSKIAESTAEDHTTGGH